MSDQNQINKLNKEWAQNLRWQGIERPYGAEEVRKLQGSLQIEHTLARGRKSSVEIDAGKPVC